MKLLHIHIGNGYDSEEIEDISSIIIKIKFMQILLWLRFEEIEDIWFIIKQLDTQISLFKGEGRPDALFKSKKVWLIIITGKLMRKLMIRFMHMLQ
jgi:hypothetical protein